MSSSLGRPTALPCARSSQRKPGRHSRSSVGVAAIATASASSPAPRPTPSRIASTSGPLRPANFGWRASVQSTARTLADRYPAGIHRSRRRGRPITSMMERALPGLAIAAAIVGAATPASAGPRIGLMADVGVPDGAVASFAICPITPVRMHIGLMHNLVSQGMRAGITYIPFASSAVSPTVSLAYGHYPEGDANPVMAYVLGDPSYSSPLLERLSYDFADAHIGVEV